ncbi:MAG: septum formation initiator family protein [Treponema sp.]|nr:septum formation initiator family protein [Treponema sp.]
MKKSYVMFFVMVVTIPVFLGVNAWQSNRCGVLRNNIRRLERAQENLVEENKTVAAEIANLLAVDRIENDARHRLGMTRVRPEDVTLIIVGGDGRGQ